MYTQCPECQTVFHITMEQLQARNGMVRCGQCDHVFNADQRLFDQIPGSEPEKSPLTRKNRAGGGKTRTAKTKTTSSSQAPTRKPVKAAKPKPAPEPPPQHIEAAPAPWTPFESVRTEKRESFASDVAAAEFFGAPVARRRFSLLWIAGIVLLAITFTAQTLYFYRDQLAASRELRPLLLEACTQLGCSLQPPYDAGRIELVQPTNIAPHPRFANVLRLRATLVNRAAAAQAHPLMQVTLTDNSGRVLSRRTFAPRQYLEQRSAGADMPPHLAVNALLDLTNPDGKANGYQIDFFAPPLDVPPSP